MDKISKGIKALFANTVSFYIVQFLNLIAPLLVLPYLSRVFSTEAFGVVTLFASLSGLLFVLNDFGFGLSATYKIAKNRTKPLVIKKVIYSIYIIKFFLFLLSVIIVYSICFYWGKVDFLFILPLIGVCFCQSYLPLWFFQGMEKMKDIVLFFTIPKFFYVSYIFIFVKHEQDIHSVFIASFLSMLINFVMLSYIMIKMGYVPKIASIKYIINELKFSSTFFLSRVSVSAYTTLSSIFVGAHAGMVQLALYGCVEKIYQASQSLTGPVIQAIFPYMANVSNRKIIFNVILFTLPFVIFIGVFIFFFSEETVTLIFGSEFSGASNVLRIFSIVIVVNFLSGILGYPAFATINKVKVVNYTVVFGGCVQLILISFFIFTKEVSAINVAFSVLVTETAIFFLRLILFLKLTKRSKVLECQNLHI
ncbi:oligosaccharide flippase family protein [Candidatus Symbiopectobacterium sp. NZEC127]|uniref:oligosaccharide flippase family protein n=1 Tax=Candidatus Symbiopectobacterium sp. NZEC127 TaxID=2820472 RepID=UPI002225FA19|nr:oligosaccharide flippase family protein [Candidatus Symbiopectobacterium sp. NZEC127]MCW2488640.1 oligosaccharide flippase family protein [Candidatus Symbiopectobacterium sp. NZEC127]